MIDKKVKVPVREQEPKVRAGNFKEVCYGYDTNEAMLEATRCLNCKNPRCVQACPVGVNIPSFIAKVKDGDIEAAAQIIAQNSSLPAVCGRVCPQESQCEGSCVVGIKNEAVSIGKLERFVADWARERDLNVSKKDPSNGIKVAVIGSGPSGLACAGDLAKKGYDVTIFEAFHEPGGVLTYGIPEFRLPKKEVVQKAARDFLKLHAGSDAWLHEIFPAEYVSRQREPDTEKKESKAETLAKKSDALSKKIARIIG